MAEIGDWVELGAGLSFGGLLSQSISSSLADALDSHTAMRALTVPRTRAEIQLLLDKLDLRLADGEISEGIYKTITEKWLARLNALQP